MQKYRIVSVVILVVAAALAWFVVSTETPESEYKIHYGLDLSGGTHLVYRADVSNVDPADVDDAMASLRSVIERRVNAFGVSEPNVQVERGGFGGEPEERLIVELPGVTDVDAAVDAIGETPLLEFKLLDQNAANATTTSTTTPDGMFVDTGLTGRLLERAQVAFGQQGFNEPFVQLEFNEEGSELFAEITRENVGEVLAIFLDGEPISLPTIQQEIIGGSAQITGTFTPEEARDLARDLNLGALPVPVELVSTQTIGASLGETAREAGVMAGIIGLSIVALFLIFWYRLPGLVAVVSLGIYLVILLALFKLIPVVLTSAGIAGLILSIGMAVDANILIFERMKEELSKGGTSILDSVQEGVSRAWLSIRDGNISTIISAIILYWAGTMLVKGFALTLGLGVLVSMLTAIVITRTFLLAIGTDKKEEKVPFLYNIGVSDITNKKL